jgi:hypothetical protein
LHCAKSSDSHAFLLATAIITFKAIHTSSLTHSQTPSAKTLRNGSPVTLTTLRNTLHNASSRGLRTARPLLNMNQYHCEVPRLSFSTATDERSFRSDRSR